jgi:hypothetical protein
MAGKLFMALIAGSFGRMLRSARRTPTACQGPVVLSRGDFEATRFAAPKLRVPAAFFRPFSGIFLTRAEVAFHESLKAYLAGDVTDERGLQVEPWYPRRSLSRRSLGAKRQAKTDPKLRRPYRRAQHRRRQSGRCPGTPSGRPWALPRDFVALWFLPYGRIARDSLHRTRRPLVAPCGDSEATRGVGLVGLVGPVRRVPGCRVRRRPVLARTRALQMA